METYDIICFGAGPTGLATAIEAKRAGMRPLVIDKGTLCNSIFNYPVNMYFFTTPELLEIGDLPLVCAAEKPTRVEALKYYRKTVEHFDLELRLFELIEKLEGRDGNFTVTTRALDGTTHKYSGKKIAVATGYYDLPNKIGAPGEDLPNVSHYYTEPHPYWRQDVVVVGGKNSAAEAALDLYRNGARVTLVHRDAELGATIKYWVRPDIENRIKAGQIAALFETRVKEFTDEYVVVENHSGTKRLAAKQVFALTGYHPDYVFIKSLGVELDEATLKPKLDPETLESNVPGIFLAGVVIGGRHTSEIFIENGRFHGKLIIDSLVGKASVAR
ncbi:MAG: YpdA family putative bacillithiol disulfide reductase [Acidobacteriota bacterium]|nr:YpdA family putative bacillithiol disulfide reductase [Acidobacteriota bacterium]